MNDWRSRWQPIDAQNDDGVDGLIFLESGGQVTGQIVFAQVKCMSGIKLDRQGRFRLPIGADKLKRNLDHWRRVVGAAVLIYVDPKTKCCRWVNLRDSSAVQGSQVFVPKHQAFDSGAKPVIALLCGNIHRDLLAPRIETEASDFSHLRGRRHVQLASRDLYRDLKRAPVRLGGIGPILAFDRHGWRHITRKGRAQLAKYQSFVLLGTARKILEGISENDLRVHQSVADPDAMFVSARAAVSFPFRQTGIVKIILRVTEGYDEKRYAFHTIYEPRRRRNVLGAREPLSQ